MNRRLSRWLLALYPRRFRDRYGAEVSNLTDELIETGQTTPLRAGLDLTFSAVGERGRALSRPRRVLAAAMAFAMVAILGFVLTGTFRQAHAQANFSAAPVACRVTFQLHAKKANFNGPGQGIAVIQPQTWTNKAGKRLHFVTVVPLKPPCSPPGFGCKSLTVVVPGPPRMPGNGIRVATPAKGQFKSVGVPPGKLTVNFPAAVRGPGCPPQPQGRRKVFKKSSRQRVP
jgi:hypothetical protein